MLEDLWRLTGLSLMLASSAARCQDRAEAHLGKGYDALRQDRYDVAVGEFRAALEIDPKLVMRA